MPVVIAVLAGVVAVATAVRSTWSPCGISMLSTLTPFSERARGRRWGLTVAWFLLGAGLGGAGLGALAAAAAALVGAVDPGASAALGVAAAAALVAAGLDARLYGPALPHHRRQVNEDWLDQFRSWVYGLGFGLQIGCGLATYIMTAGVYLTIVLAGLTASPVAALLLGVGFGLVRGLAVLVGAPLTDRERVAAFHRRFEAAREPVRHAVIGVEAAVAVVAAGAAGGAAAGAAALAALGVGALVVHLRGPVAPAVDPSVRVEPA